MTIALELQQLEKTYPGGVRTLRGIDLQVEMSNFYVLPGPSGAGRSVTINIVGSLINKTPGQINISGYGLERDIISAKRQLDPMPQEFNFDPLETVQRIIVNQVGCYGTGCKEAYIRNEKYPKQLDLQGKHNEHMRTLSGGIKHRLIVARVLVHEPELLILGEPVAGMDIKLRRSIWGSSKGLNDKDTIIILVTYYLEETEILCRDVDTIQHSELMESTSMRALLARLKSETFILNLASKSSSSKPDGYQYRLVGTVALEVEILREQGISNVFTQLGRRGIQVLNIRNKANRLEEPFVSSVNERQGDRT